MTLIESKGRPYVACVKCGANVVWLGSLTGEDKKRIATAVRSDTLRGTQLLHSRFGLDLREAKALSFHITCEAGKCHRCDSSVSGEVSVCSKCHSANLDW